MRLGNLTRTPAFLLHQVNILGIYELSFLVFINSLSLSNLILKEPQSLQKKVEYITLDENKLDYTHTDTYTRKHTHYIRSSSN